MNRMTKLCGRLLSLTLAATTILSSVPVASMTTYAAEESTCVTADVEADSLPGVEEDSLAAPEVLATDDGEPAGGEETTTPETPGEGTTEPAGGEETTTPETPGEGTTEPAGGEETTAPETPGEGTTEPAEGAETGLTEDAETGLTEDAEIGQTATIDEMEEDAAQLDSAPAWTSKAPVVKFSSSTDTTIKFTITAPKGISDLSNAWYLVSVVNTADSEDSRDVYYQAGASQPYSLQVIEGNSGDGHKATYSVTARLLTTTNGEEPVDDESNVEAQSKKSAVVKMSTKNPYYATSISLKAVNSTIYNTRLNDKICLAKVNFGSDTTYNTITDVSLTNADGYGCSEWNVYYENGYIYLTDADDYTNGFSNRYFVYPGKFTLKVTAAAPEDTGPATAKMTVNVVNGIYDFDLSDTLQTIYKPAGKSATATITISLNRWSSYSEDGNYSYWYKPKNQRYVYSYLDEETGKYSTDPSVLLGSYTNARGKQISYVTCNNGKITIDKNYQLPKGKDSETFTIHVKANDYATNEVANDITFTVKSEASQFNSLVLVDKDNKPVTIAKAGIPISDLEWNVNDSRYHFIGIAKGVTVGADGAYDSSDIIDTEEFVVTSNNKNVAVYDDDYYYVSIASEQIDNVLNKSVTFTAKSVDGTKTSKLTFKIVGAVPEGEVNAYIIASNDEKNEKVLQRGETLDVADMHPEQGMVIGMKDDAGYLADEYDYTVQTSGLTVVDQYSWAHNVHYVANRCIMAYMLGEKATITVKNGGKVVARYNLINSNYTNKAVTLSAVKGSKLYYNYNFGYGEPQSMVYNVKNVPATAVSAGVEALSGYYDYYNYDPQTNRLTLTFDYCYPETMKFAVTFYDQDGNSVTKPATITIKPVKLTMSSKLTKTSYSMKNTEGGNIQLSVTGSNIESVTFNSIRSANIKGQSNRFTYYYDLTSDGKLTLDVPFAGLTKNKSQSLAGYVTYTVTYKGGKTETKTTKITVKVTGAPVYTDQT